MPGHDLKQLLSRDFEELTRDLLQAEWTSRLSPSRLAEIKGLIYVGSSRGRARAVARTRTRSASPSGYRRAGAGAESRG